jgi:hypothetical protein
MNWNGRKVVCSWWVKMGKIITDADELERL